MTPITPAFKKEIMCSIRQFDHLRHQRSRVSSLPKEVQGVVFSFLGMQELQSCMRTSKAFSEVTILETGANLQSYISRVCLKLNDGRQKTELRSICCSITPGLNISKAIKAINEIERKIIDVFITFSEDELKALKDISLPGCFEDVWIIEKICRSIPAINSPSVSYRARKDVLRSIANLLEKAGDVEAVIAVANAFPEARLHEDALIFVSDCLVKAGHVDRAVAILSNIQHAEACGWALEKIVGYLVTVRDFDRAIAVANRIQDKHCHGRALKEIARYLAKTGHIGTAIAFAQSIQDECYRDGALKKIIGYLTKTACH